MRLKLTNAVILDLSPERLQESGLRIWVSGESGAGKALALSTPIPTPFGWTTMGDIEVGDVIYDDRGAPCTVTAATEVMHGHPCFKVEFDTGASIVADAGHRWRTFSASERHREFKASAEFREHRRRTRIDGGRENRKERPQVQARYSPPAFTGSVVTTETIAASVLFGFRRESNHALRVIPGIATSEVTLPIDPYVLGVWLGDGTTATAEVTKLDAALFDCIRERGYASHVVPSRPMSRRIEGLERLLRLNGLLGNKHIPPAYLRASREQRLELLKGLMDTDGSTGKTYRGKTVPGAVEFSNTNFNIAQGVVELARSLGHKVALKPGIAKLNGREIGPYWRASWTPPEPVFTLARKLALQRLGTRSTLKWHYITKVTPVPSVPVRCISVSSPSCLFLASEHMIPTHNSTANCLIASSMLEQGEQLVVFDAHGEYEHLWALGPGCIQRIGYAGDPVTEDSVEWCLDVVRNGKSLLLDLSHWTDLAPEKLDAFVLAFITGLYELRRRQPQRTFLLLEEAANFIPQQQSTGQFQNVKKFLAIVTGGRKFGINFLLSSQRPSLVDITALSGCNVRIFLRVSETQDYKRIKMYLPADITFRRIAQFQSGEAVICSRWIADGVVHSRLLRPSVAPTKFLA